MQLGKTLIGAIIGAVLGIALMVAINLKFQSDKMWLAIPVALLTGLGVRMMVSTSGHASYLRGAITVLLAMGAYLGGFEVSKAVANYRSKNASAQMARVEGAQEPGSDKDKANEPAVPPTPDPTANGPLKGATPATARAIKAMPGAISPWDIISLAVAALLAYELGRGTAAVPVRVVESSDAPPAGAHPDA